MLSIIVHFFLLQLLFFFYNSIYYASNQRYSPVLAGILTQSWPDFFKQIGTESELAVNNSKKIKHHNNDSDETNGKTANRPSFCNTAVRKVAFLSNVIEFKL